MALFPFSRAFRNVNRYFPGARFVGPSSIADSAMFVAQLFRPSVMEDVRFSQFTDIGHATGGAALNVDLPEPSAGFMHIPVCLAVSYSGATNILCSLYMLATATAVDAWGRYGATDSILATARVVDTEYINFNPPPYMRGQQLRVRFPSPAGATNVTVYFLYIEMPAELASLDLWRGVNSNFTNTRALP